MVYKNTVKFILRDGGIEKITRAGYFYFYDKIKRNGINLTNKKTILGKYDIQTLPNDEGISTELQIYGIHEPLTTHLVLNEIKEGMVCLDLGSNIGYYAIIESNIVGKSGKIFAIEPSPINFPILKTNLENQKMENYTANNIAIGEKDEEMEFIVSKKSNWSKIRMNNEEINSGDEVIKIPVKTLDLFVKENSIEKIDVLRMDVEGYEYNILKGAEKILEEYKPKLLIEVHKMYLGTKKTLEMLKILENLKYEIKFFVPRVYDTPIIGKTQDIKKISMEEVLQKLENNDLPDAFQVILENKIAKN